MICTGMVIALGIVSSIPASIVVEAGQVVGSFDSLLVSTGDEIVQKMTYPGFTELAISTGTPLLRMGGMAVEYYDWEADNYNGMHIIDIADLLIPIPLENSLDNLLQFCEETDIEPLLTVNYHINDPGKAARMVEYCNGDVSTPMGAVRASRGHPEPYNVTLWCVGNEPDMGGFAMSFPPYGEITFFRHFGIPMDQWAVDDSVFATADDFAELASVYIDTMRASSPIPLEIGGLSLAQDLSWIEPVLELNREKMDWMDIHYYPVVSFSADSTQYRYWLASPTSGSSSKPPLEVWYPMIVDTVEKYSGGYDIPLWVLEYNIMAMVDDPVWSNYLDGLFIADCIGHMARAGVPVAASYSIAEGDPSEDVFPQYGVIRTDTLSMRSSAWVMKLYNDRFGNTVVEAFSNQVSGGYGLEVYASRFEDWTLSLMVVNKNLDSAYTASIDLNGYSSDGTADVWQIVNDMPIGAPWNGTSGITYQGEITGSPGSFSHTFPKASVTCIWINPDPAGLEEMDFSQQVSLVSTPNPATGSVSFQYSMQEPASGIIEIFSVSGRLIRSLELNSSSTHGNYLLVWDRTDSNGRIVPPGIYMAKLTQANSAHSDVTKLILLH
ncbi:MAG: T9SS type A sorting domain-containing protein [Candidatus Sabulitectum sp.]|nr:T9SS type A sorting domain-containing protein [Candidatus Sabulitectum sp.]